MNARLSSFLLLPLLTALLALASCPSGPPPENDEAVDADLAYRVVDVPVVDGENLLLEKYNFGRPMLDVSNSVPSSTEAGGVVEDNYVPPRDRWVLLRTSKGDIKLEVHAEWAPRAAARFISLVEEGFYDGAPWFRVNDNIAQTGIAADPEMGKLHEGETIPRDENKGSNTRGMVSFAQVNPDSRNTSFFINLTDNPNLDNELNYFVPFAEVMEGMDVLDALFKTGEPRPGLIEQLAEQGVSAFRRQFPEGDVIESAILMN